MISVEKLGAACFEEILQANPNLQSDKEKGNLYIGLKAMAETLEVLFHAIRNIDQRLNLIETHLENHS